MFIKTVLKIRLQDISAQDRHRQNSVSQADSASLSLKTSRLHGSLGFLYRKRTQTQTS